MENKKKIVLIGAGNIAHFLAPQIHGKKYHIIQIYSRSTSSAQILADKLNTAFTNQFSQINADADIYLIAVPDNAIEEVCANIKFNNAIIAHTSGSTHIDILQKYSNNYGVLYPFQTFSKNAPTQNKKFPVFIESNNDNTFNQLQEIAKLLSENIFPLSSNQRMMLHIAAVFACNFTNAMYAIAADICKNNHIDFDWLKPLITETANKMNHATPSQVQTGPAIRKDKITLEKHLAILRTNPELCNIYNIISEYIMRNRH